MSLQFFCTLFGSVGTAYLQQELYFGEKIAADKPEDQQTDWDRFLDKAKSFSIVSKIAIVTLLTGIGTISFHITGLLTRNIIPLNQTNLFLRFLAGVVTFLFQAIISVGLSTLLTHVAAKGLHSLADLAVEPLFNFASNLI